MTPLEYCRQASTNGAACYFNHSNESTDFWRGYVFAMKEIEHNLLKHQVKDCSVVCTCEDTKRQRNIDMKCNKCFIYGGGSE